MNYLHSTFTPNELYQGTLCINNVPITANIIIIGVNFNNLSFKNIDDNIVTINSASPNGKLIIEYHIQIDNKPFTALLNQINYHTNFLNFQYIKLNNNEKLQRNIKICDIFIDDNLPIASYVA